MKILKYIKQKINRENKASLGSLWKINTFSSITVNLKLFKRLLKLDFFKMQLRLLNGHLDSVSCYW